MPTDNVPMPPALLWLTIAFAACGLLATVLVAIKAWRNPPLLPYEPRRPVPWGPMDLLLVFLCFLALGYVAGQILIRFTGGRADGPPTAPELNVNSAIELCGVAIAILIMRLNVGANRADLGFETKRVGRDIGVGAVAFLASVVPIFALQAVLETWFEYRHPLIKALVAKPDAAMLVATSIAAVVAAPLFEELIFRVLLQGWFEAVESRRRTMRQESPADGPAAWPIMLSALLFSLMHLGQGSAPIPLFFLAVVLGYIYQQTHRIWPSLTTHILLNSTSLLLLWWQIPLHKP